jgi:hypothetical protein
MKRKRPDFEDTDDDDFDLPNLPSCLWPIVGGYGHKSEQFMWSQLIPQITREKIVIDEICTWKWVEKEVVEHQLVRVMWWAAKTLPNWCWTENMHKLLVQQKASLDLLQQAQCVDFNSQILWQLALAVGHIDFLREINPTFAWIPAWQYDDLNTLQWWDMLELKAQDKIRQETGHYGHLPDPSIPAETWEKAKQKKVSSQEKVLWDWLFERQKQSTVLLERRIRELLRIAAKRGYLTFLRVFWWDSGIIQELCEIAVQAGQLEVVTEFISAPVDSLALIHKAIRYKQLEILCWLESRRGGQNLPSAPLTVEAMCLWYLAQDPRLFRTRNIDRWILNLEPTSFDRFIHHWFNIVEPRSVWVAVTQSQLKYVKRNLKALINLGCKRCETSSVVSDILSQNPNPELVIWLHQAGFPFPRPLQVCLAELGVFDECDITEEDLSEKEFELALEKEWNQATEDAVLKCAILQERLDLIQKFGIKIEGQHEQIFLAVALRRGNIKMLRWFGDQQKFPCVCYVQKINCSRRCLFMRIFEKSVILGDHFDVGDYHSGHRQVLDYLWDEQLIHPDFDIDPVSVPNNLTKWFHRKKKD